jgi:hypothetical protein
VNTGDAAALGALRDGIAALTSLMQEMCRKLDVVLARGADAGERFAEAVLASWGEEPFYAADILDWADEVPELRRDLRDAARALCRTACRPTGRQLGCALRRLERVPMMWHRVESVDVRGTAQWTIRPLQD